MLGLGVSVLTSDALYVLTRHMLCVSPICVETPVHVCLCSCHFAGRSLALPMCLKAFVGCGVAFCFCSVLRLVFRNWVKLCSDMFWCFPLQILGYVIGNCMYYLCCKFESSRGVLE